MGFQPAVDKSESPTQVTVSPSILITTIGQVYSTDGDSRVSVGGYQLATSLKPSFLCLADGDGQEIGDVDQLQPAAEPLCDSHSLPISLMLADELDPALDPSVLSVDYETQPLGVTSRESPELLVSFPLPDSKAASYLTEPIHFEGQHLSNCVVAVLDDVSSGMPIEAAVKEASTVDSIPSPHDVQRDLAPEVDSAARESVPDGSSSGCEAAVQACRYVVRMLLPTALTGLLPDGLIMNYLLCRQEQRPISVRNVAIEDAGNACGGLSASLPVS
ncbi:hypothetical protein Nepgr_032044 [Nepenthes gracilis]|uniref:Uncharacterized protein n=1 Tax=Nepenthes gracilis TaxID=150966 RepID=A0AAD3TJK9_NEPGR|nr:hypothetical protein Nepgr_032044 [Nepenthes gracilis]